MSRLYNINGNKYESVTSALEVIQSPFVKSYPEYADIGTRVHNAVKAINLSKKPKTDIDIVEMVNLYKDWKKENVEQIIDVAKVVYHHIYKYAGEFDFICILKGDYEPTLVDLKTSSSIGSLCGLQLVAYKKAYEMLTEVKIKKTMILQITRPSQLKLKAHYFNKHEDNFRLFLYALELKRGLKNVA